MAQLDIATYMSQVFWLMVIFMGLYVLVASEGGILESISKMVKARSKMLKGVEAITESEVKGEKIEIVVVNSMKKLM